MISSLYPFPGGKSDRKYDPYLFPLFDCTAIAEPFMGAGCRSLMNCDRLQPILGEINPAQREIALALGNPEAYVSAYNEARDHFWGKFSALVGDDILAYTGRKNSQTQLSKDYWSACKGLTENWRDICSDIYRWMQVGNSKLAGYYAFAIRACFGNVMRLTPAGTHFNVSWHVDKLAVACAYDPRRWIDELSAKRWDPIVLPTWEDAIAAVDNPSKCYLLLDPPYTCDHSTEKMTPCYSAHSIGTEGRNEETLQLAIASLKAGLERGFPVISVCNYFVPKLDDAIRELTSDAGYSIQTAILGECKALGNSNGRRKHGDRVDGRAKPVEVIYRIERVPTKFFAVEAPKKVEQLALL